MEHHEKVARLRELLARAQTRSALGTRSWSGTPPPLVPVQFIAGGSAANAPRYVDAARWEQVLESLVEDAAAQRSVLPIE